MVSRRRGGGGGSSTREPLGVRQQSVSRLTTSPAPSRLVHSRLANLGAPSALVGGAALASFYDLKADLEPADGDKRWVSVCKKASVILFFSAFAFEITCVFVTTVTGTLLQGNAVNGMATSSIALMQRELEFEYLASRVTFFQGLLNWLAAVSLHQILPSEGTQGKPFADLTAKEKSLRRQQLMTGSSMTAMGLMMLAFYNGHMAAGIYCNYGHMLLRLLVLTFNRYFAAWPLRLIPMVAIIPITAAIINGYKAFRGEVADRAGGGAKRRALSKAGFKPLEPWPNDTDSF